MMNSWYTNQRVLDLLAIRRFSRLTAVFALLAGPAAMAAESDTTTAPAASPDAAAQTAAPVISVDSAIHDFGIIWSGSKLEHTFTIRNTGDAPLQILKVDPKCGCTLAGEYPKVIAPGASGGFPFALDTNRFRSSFSKNITIESNDPKTRELTLTLQGVAREKIDVQPDRISMGLITGKEPITKSAKIVNNLDRPVKLELSLDPPAEALKVELVETEPGKVFELRATISPPFKPGVVHTTALLKTSWDEPKQISVPIYGSVPERIYVAPTIIRVLPINGNTNAIARGMVRAIRVINYGETPVKVLEATVDSPKFEKPRVVEQKPGKQYLIQVTIPVDYQPPDEGNTLTLLTDDPQTPSIRIPIQQHQSASTRVRPAEQLVGQRTPEFHIKTLDGAELDNGSFAKHKATVLNFVAADCAACRQQIPMVEKITQAFKDQDVRFVNVCGRRSRLFSDDEVRKVMDGLGWTAELATDPERHLTPIFKITSTPTLFVIDETGQIRNVIIGWRNVKDVNTILAKLLNIPVPDKDSASASKGAGHSPS